jgi:hypothetical protein
VKQLKDYTDAELIQVGKKAVEAKIRQAKHDQETNETKKALWKAYKEGKISIPGAKK